MPVLLPLTTEELLVPRRVADALAALALVTWLPPRRWFGSKSRVIARVEIVDAFTLSPGTPTAAALAILRVEYDDGQAGEHYALPFAVATAADAATIALETPEHVIATADEGRVVVHDVIGEQWGSAAMRLIANGTAITGDRSMLRGDAARACGALCAAIEGLPVRLLGAEQSNTSFRIGDRIIAKIVRRLEPGMNPDYEIGRHLTEQTSFAHVPRVAGAILHAAGDGEEAMVVIAQAFVPNEGSAWDLALRDVNACLVGIVGSRPPSDTPTSLVDAAWRPLPAPVVSTLGSAVGRAHLLGRRTAELHLALATPAGNPAFEPTPLTRDARERLAGSMRREAQVSLDMLEVATPRLAGSTRATAARLAGQRDEVLRTFDDLAATEVATMCIRVHGDYHLGQVLVAGDDFVILDFEGEPRRPIATRRATQVALKDVAGMLRSYGYVTWSACLAMAEGDETRLEALSGWARWIETWMSVAFLQGYVESTRGASFVPADAAHLSLLLHAFLLEKALYEVRYEIDNRPAWLRIPLQGLMPWRRP